MADDKLPDEFWKSIIDLARSYFSSHKERKAAKDASWMKFWRNEMLDSLRKIALGDPDPRNFSILQAQLEATEEEYQASRVRLLQMRDGLAARRGMHQAAEALDDLLHGPVGKGYLRVQINNLIDAKGADFAPMMAAEVVREIEVFNEALERFLRRL